jgi:hypothetical protein
VAALAVERDSNGYITFGWYNFILSLSLLKKTLLVGLPIFVRVYGILFVLISAEIILLVVTHNHNKSFKILIVQSFKISNKYKNKFNFKNKYCSATSGISARRRKHGFVDLSTGHLT